MCVYVQQHVDYFRSEHNLHVLFMSLLHVMMHQSIKQCAILVTIGSWMHLVCIVCIFSTKVLSLFVLLSLEIHKRTACASLQAVCVWSLPKLRPSLIFETLFKLLLSALNIYQEWNCVHRSCVILMWTYFYVQEYGMYWVLSGWGLGDLRMGGVGFWGLGVQGVFFSAFWLHNEGWQMYAPYYRQNSGQWSVPCRPFVECGCPQKPITLFAL